MIVVDTNVLSAMMHADVDPLVVAWFDRQSPESIWTTTITVFEVCFGLELLPPSRRRKQLEEAFARSLKDDLEGRVLPFDDEAARAAASHAAARRKAGTSIDIRDV